MKVETSADEQLPDEDKWLENCDLQGFKKEIDALGKELLQSQGKDDVEHLNKILLWNQMLTLFGLLTLGVYPNIFTVFCLSTATFSRWTMIGHHVCHGGYDRVDETGRFHRFRFAIGSLYRRCLDWLDWMLPEAWNVEHNKLHHYNLNEDADPDLVEANLLELRNIEAPMIFKYLMVLFYMATWKWLYYAPNTFSYLQLDEGRRRGQVYPIAEGERNYVTILTIRNAPEWLNVSALLFRVLFPYFAIRFLITPLPVYLLFGLEAYQCGIMNLLLAEVLTNVHSFIAIVTNHAGKDLYRFDTPCVARSEHFYLRQVIGSADFACGNDVVDFLHGFLNYQIEHHLWPALSMLSYQRSQPRVKAICKKYGIPYIQENVFIRLKKTIDIMVGTSTMRKFPAKFNPQRNEEEETTISESDFSKVH